MDIAQAFNQERTLFSDSFQKTWSFSANNTIVGIKSNICMYITYYVVNEKNK